MRGLDGSFHDLGLPLPWPGQGFCSAGAVAKNPVQGWEQGVHCKPGVWSIHWEFWVGPGCRLLHPHWEGNKLCRQKPKLCLCNCPKWPGSVGKLAWLSVFSALCLGWDLHLVFCASVGVPVLCNTLWDGSASSPKCHWAERHVNVLWGLVKY